MPIPRGPTREVYDGLALPRAPRKGAAKRAIILILLGLLIFLVYVSLYLRSVTSATVLSDAQDQVTLAVNETVHRVLAEKDYGYDDFVTLQKDADGNVTAITTDAARINLLSTEILSEMARAADSGKLDVRIPLGDLLGSNLLLGRGPGIPVKVTMMTSSFVRFENDLTSTGINQSRHTLKLVADVDIDLLIPWGTISTAVETEILVAETIIVGRVPNTYLNME